MEESSRAPEREQSLYGVLKADVMRIGTKMNRGPGREHSGGDSGAENLFSQMF